MAGGHAQHLAPAVAVDADGDDDGHRDDAVVAPADRSAASYTTSRDTTDHLPARRAVVAIIAGKPPPTIYAIR